MKKAKIKAILFDLDNVILDTHPVLKKYIIEITKNISNKKEHELETKDIHHIKEWMKKSKIKINFLKKIKYLLEFISTDIHKIKPIKEMPKLIEKISKDFDLAIISNAPKIYVKKVLKLNKLNGFFKTIQTSSNNKPKPSTNMIYSAAKKLKISVKECVVVDDSKSGIMAGTIANCKTIYFSKEKNVKADYYASNAKELEIILNKLIKR